MRKCTPTTTGGSFSSTMMPPITAWTMMPMPIASVSRVRSRRRDPHDEQERDQRDDDENAGERAVAELDDAVDCPSPASGPASRPVQYGHSGHPSPEPVSRTSPPVADDDDLHDEVRPRSDDHAAVDAVGQPVATAAGRVRAWRRASSRRALLAASWSGCAHDGCMTWAPRGEAEPVESWGRLRAPWAPRTTDSLGATASAN